VELIIHPPSSVEVKERMDLYLYFPSGPSWPDIGAKFTIILIIEKMYKIIIHEIGQGIGTVISFTKLNEYSNVMRASINSLQIFKISSALCLVFARGRVKRQFLFSNVCAVNMLIGLVLADWLL
jgi:hypothetical protein